MNIFPSNELIQNILQGIPYQYYTLYLNIEDDIFYDLEHYEAGEGLNLLDYKLTDHALFTNYPEKWQDEYFNREMMEYDPVLLHGCHTLFPYTWGRYSSTLPHLNSKNLLKLLKQSRNFGIENGISVPIGMGIKIYGIFTITFDNTLILNGDIVYQIASLLQNLGTYIVSYEAPTPLKPLNGRQKLILMQSFNALLQQSNHLKEKFEQLLQLNSHNLSPAFQSAPQVNLAYP
ncbi:autoinducer binding domain-containing protein [Candidatus Odyssella acanthamoebae]|uniref:Transcription factor LuxR-like autoinducer-binding domain-containing protein n=1 Tax=Candidatus Odyssella acanthamoebae TaxID=91604 RepID=A0A077AY31_9PROT|nr:autoinducer binding domain-containing protein [Candidatus Paracaedibacter acanthamoebae]AIK96548.1 hypothetical protein ID47_07065 [Candidatus Paracaedibacter acanthamoebae]